ncbi:MAG: ATP-binding cassette domain-containing protein, partial [Microbacteriaceae bacterium]|nr:ATP-binding cassette domain-containing protein [Microbacteriaceae bacterium]
MPDITPSPEILDVSNLNVYYGRVHVLQDVSFSMGAEPLGILGRNGMGKSTLVKALMGFIPTASGEANFEGTNIIGLPSYKINRRGIAYVPQGRRIFRSLTVHEH